MLNNSSEKNTNNQEKRNVFIFNSNRESDEYNLRSFLSTLENKNELLIIHKKVNKKFQLASIVGKLDKKEAILFTNVEGSKFKVAANILGTRNRFFYGIKTNRKDGKIDFPNFANINKESYPIKVSSEAPFYKNNSKNLFDLPIITHFEKDAGPFITSSIIFVQDKETETQNSSTHRMLLLNEKEMVIRMVEGRHLHKCFIQAKEHKEDLKINVVIGYTYN